jgi:hypothetical protein
MALIDEILHHVARLYRQQGNQQVIRQAQQWLVESIRRLSTARQEKSRDTEQASG